jgi:DNA-binding SARP family transcriptional activator/TolB-like protein/Flp pilus assembly protein TadD
MERMTTGPEADGFALAPRPERLEVANRPVIRIHLLGAMRATSCLGHNVLPAGKRARALLGYLCLAGGREVDRAGVASMLWEEASLDGARTNLRQVVHELSAAFGEFAEELLTSTRCSLRLHVDACWIDALAARECDAADADDIAMAVHAFCPGELLEDLDGVSEQFDEWLLHERLRMTERQRHLLHRAIPLAESDSAALRGLARLLGEVDDRAAALAGYTRRGEALRQAAARDSDRLRVGVLPFLTRGTAGEDDLAFGLAQEISSALSRFRWFDAIKLLSYRTNRSMRYIDEQRLLSLDLDYVVDGTVSGRGSFMQISVRLMNIHDIVKPVWSHEFKLLRNELHRLNELVTAKIVACIDPVILFIEGQPKGRDRFGPTGMLLLAIPLLYSMERRKYEEGGKLIRQAYAEDPDNSMVAAWMAHWHLFYIGQGWAEDTAETLAAVREYAARAVRLDPGNAEALGIYAHCCAYGDKDFDTAVKYFDRALRLNPSLAFIWAYSALTYCYIGDPDEALRRLERYRELAPVDPYFSLFENAFTIAYAFKGDYERAVLVGRRVVRANPGFAAGYKPLIAALGHLDRKEEAAPYIAKLRELEPNFTVEGFGRTYPFKRASDRRRYQQGLLLAGVRAG